MQWVILVIAVGMLTVGFFRVYLKRAREAPLRRAARSSPVRYMTSVRVKARDEAGAESELRNSMNLIVRSGFIEVSGPGPFLGAALGMEFYFPAAAVTIETHRSRRGLDWIWLTGESAGKVIRLSIANKNSTREIWDALTGAGAMQLGSRPPGERLP